MSKLVLNGDVSGSVTLDAPSVSGTTTLTLPTTSGTIITDASTTGISASALSTGTVPTARLASGTANSTTYLRGDQTWATVSGGVTSLNGQSGAITNTDYGVIGSYVIAAENDFTASQERLPNVTVAGSTLVRDNQGPTNVSRPFNSATGTSSSVVSGSNTSLSLNGTWRRMARSVNNNVGNVSAMNLYVRIS